MTDRPTSPAPSPEDLVLPFPALVGQEHVKRALLMLAVNPKLGGLLIRGEKGTGKSTAARSLSRLMPELRVNRDCPFGCPSDLPQSWCSECREGAKPKTTKRRPPFVTLPLGITEDQLLGTFDLERALRLGEKRFEPGLLAKVNQGVLYVDEVNLLDDHIVDLLLDCAATGVNVVAREGISASHPAEFLLVGTMNPEEGELRPQLQDRFGLCAEIRTLEDIGMRSQIVERCLAFEKNPPGFRKQWSAAEKDLTASIAKARKILPAIESDGRWHTAAARLSLSLDVHGHRPDILMVKAAATVAALHGRREIEDEDIEAAASLVYPHRLRRHPFEGQTLSETELREHVREAIRPSKRSGSKKKSPTSKKE